MLFSLSSNTLPMWPEKLENNKKKKHTPALVLRFGDSRTAGRWRQPCNVEGAGYRFRQPLLVQSHIRCVQLCLRASEAKPSCWWKHKGPSSTGWGPPYPPGTQNTPS